MQRTLESRRALVTGGSRGIGAAIARRFAQEGASVAFTYSGSAEVAERTADWPATWARAGSRPTTSSPVPWTPR